MKSSSINICLAIRGKTAEFIKLQEKSPHFQAQDAQVEDYKSETTFTFC
jgi:hypothetical protein